MYYHGVFVVCIHVLFASDHIRFNNRSLQLFFYFFFISEIIIRVVSGLPDKVYKFETII